jgi:hypothetical protein
MRRLAMTALIGVVAFAVPGSAPSSGAARTTSTPPAAIHAGGSTPLPERLAIEGPPAPPRAGVTRRVAPTAASRSDAGGRSTDAVWAALAQCESNGNPPAVSESGRYFGAFQFSLATWHSLGYGGSPIQHSYAQQLEAAKRLLARSGWAQWPACSRHLGLR